MPPGPSDRITPQASLVRESAQLRLMYSPLTALIGQGRGKSFQLFAGAVTSGKEAVTMVGPMMYSVFGEDLFDACASCKDYW